MASTSAAKAWRAAAKKYGLTFDEEAEVMTGDLRGFPAIIGDMNGQPVAMVAFTPPLDLFWDPDGAQQLVYASGSWDSSHPRAEALLDEPLRRALDRLAEFGRVLLRLVCVRVSLTKKLTRSAELTESFMSSSRSSGFSVAAVESMGSVSGG